MTTTAPAWRLQSGRLAWSRVGGTPVGAGRIPVSDHEAQEMELAVRDGERGWLR
jgi:hypothetical protein